MSSVTDTIDEFKRNVRDVMEEEGLGPHQIFYCDRTGSYYKLMSDKNLSFSCRIAG